MLPKGPGQAAPLHQVVVHQDAFLEREDRKALDRHGGSDARALLVLAQRGIRMALFGRLRGVGR